MICKGQEAALDEGMTHADLLAPYNNCAPNLHITNGFVLPAMLHP